MEKRPKLLDLLHKTRMSSAALGCSGMVALAVGIAFTLRGNFSGFLVTGLTSLLAAFLFSYSAEQTTETILAEFPFQPTAETVAFSLEALQSSKRIRERATVVLLRILPLLDSEERTLLNSRHHVTLSAMLVLAKEERRRYDPRIVASILDLLYVPLNTATQMFVSELTGRRMDPLVRQAAQEALERSRLAVLKRDESARLLRPSAPTNAQNELLRPAGSSVRQPEEQLLHVTNDL